MSIVHVLDETTINKIAAGEVVERPASVVKELVENAIDAGADRIEVEIQAGGTSLMRVTDNGKGMSMEDAKLAILRHATSKIQDAGDLLSIGTLGFRGEALPTIASVSRFSMRTRQQGEELGTLVLITGGKEPEIRETGCSLGTTVQVEDLFFNTPARKKFLKTNHTEASKINDFIVKLALSHPEIAFRFIHGNKLSVVTPGNGNCYDAIKSIYGANTVDAGSIEFTFHGLPTEEANDAFEKDYRRRLNANHQAHPEDERAIWLWNGYTQSLQMERGISIIRTALWIVGLFTLLSGIVGVSNIMLITVKERTHEFGIRKAIGAKPWSILKLIIVESVIITTFFGYIGMVLGVCANEYMDATVGHETVDTGLFQATMFLNPTVGLDVCFEATMVMIIAGTIAGLIPAFKASRIRPIEALRAD